MITRIIGKTIIALCSFEMAFAMPISNFRSISSVEHKEKEEIIFALTSYKNAIRGVTNCVKDNKSDSEIDSLIRSGDKEVNYYTYLSDFKKNSCTSSSNEIKENQSLEQKCERDPSLVEALVKAVSEIDMEDSKAQIKLSHNERTIYNSIRKAKQYKVWVEEFLRSDESDEDKEEVVLNYISSISVSLRDLYVVLRPFSSLANMFKDYMLLNISSDLFEEGTDAYDQLQLGLNPSQDPYFITVKNNGNNLVLAFDEHSMIKRDIQTIAQFPMAKNYLYALRMMTVQMMTSQIKTYDVISGNVNRVIDMPKSCVTNNANGVWPAKINLEIREDIGNGYLDAVLENHGLTYNFNNDLVLNYYIEESNVDPLKDALYGAVEFNNYTNAKKNAAGNSLYTPYLKPVLDDTTAYSKFIEEKLMEARSVYYYKTGGGRASKSRQMQYKDNELLNEIVSEESPYSFLEINKSGVKSEIRPFTLNASKYLSHKLSELNADKIADIIDLDTKKTLQNNKIKIELPSLYSPSVYRNWGLKTISKVVEGLKNNNDINSPVVKSLVNVCAITYSQFCAVNKNKDLYKKLSEYLDSLNIDGRLLPLAKLNEKGIEKNYKLLYYLWNELRDRHNLIPEALTNEYDYILDQMNVLNPIARARLGYLLARQELVSLKTGKALTYTKTARGSRVSQEYLCHQNNINGQIERLDKSAGTLMLNKVLRPFFLSTYISNDEATKLWNKVLETVNSNSSQLFTAKINEKQIYDYIESISLKKTLNREDTNNVVDSILDGKMFDETQDAIDEANDSQEVDRIAFFQGLMKEKNHEKRLAMYLDRAREFGINDEVSLKEQILSVDLSFKRLLYRDVMKRAAIERRAQTLKKLDAFCKLNEDDHDSLKENFFSTMKVQDGLNQMIGLQGAPRELMDKLNSMTDQELINTGLGVGGFLLGMAGVMLAGSCAVLTGGLCGLAVAGLVTAGMGAQTYVFVSEVEMKQRANQSVDYVNEMSDLGYSELGASDNVSRSWAWAVIEGVSIIPLVGLFSRGVSMGAKMTKESLKTIVLNSGKSNFSNVFKFAGKSARTVVDEADVGLAKVVLGFTSYSDELKLLLAGKNLDQAADAMKAANLTAEQASKVQTRIARIRKLHTAGKISTKKMSELTKRVFAEIQELAIKNNNGIYKYTSDVVTDMSFKSIDNQMAKTVSKYFGGNPMEMRSFMGSYIKKFMPRKTLTGAAKASKAQVAKEGYEAAKEGKYLFGTNWMRQAWYENTYNLAKNEESFLRIYDELLKLPKGEFESYIAKNADQLTDMFVKAPLRKRDLPYLFIQGGPHLGGLLNGRRIPGLQEIGEAVVVRKIFNARARLIAESAKAQAREVLGTSSALAADTLSGIFKSFYTVSRESALKASSTAAGKKTLEELALVRKAVLDSMFEGLSNNPKMIDLLKKEGVNIFVDNKINKGLLNKLLYENADIKAEVYADMLWGLVDAEKLYKLKEFEFIAYKVMRETVQDQSLTGIQKYLAMAKILLVRDNLGVVELF